MIKFAKQLFVGEEGATMVEYALLIALIGAVVATTVPTLSSAISGKFTAVSTTITGGS
jgi:Flp pilus assembly pilin Flp